MKKYKILLIEDDLVTVELVSQYLTNQDYLVTYANTITMGVSYLHKRTFDILLLDLRLSDSFGLEIFKKISSSKIPPVIVLSAYSDIQTKLKAFDFGVEDYMCKPYNLEELNARIRKILKNKNSDETDINIDSYEKFHIEKDQIYFNNIVLDLTKMEFKILKELIINKNSIVLRDNLLNKFQLSSKSRSIDYHIKNIRDKINDSQNKETYLFTQYGVGYKLIF